MTIVFHVSCPLHAFFILHTACVYVGLCNRLLMLILLADLKFASSSGMRPRWLVFAMMLPSEDVLFVHYTAPTIIMSRSCGQSEKVKEIPPPRCWPPFPASEAIIWPAMFVRNMSRNCDQIDNVYFEISMKKN